MLKIDGDICFWKIGVHIYHLSKGVDFYKLPSNVALRSMKGVAQSFI